MKINTFMYNIRPSMTSLISSSRWEKLHKNNVVRMLIDNISQYHVHKDECTYTIIFLLAQQSRMHTVILPAVRGPFY